LLTLTTFKRYLLALASGAISYFAYPSPAFWPAIFISILGLYLSVRGLNFWKAFGVGFLGGAAYYVAQIYWISQYLGPRPLVGLAAIEALIFAIGAGFIALATKRLQSPWQLALLVSILWNAREWVATHFPYGGFPWSRVAMSQSNSPLAFWVAVGGFGLLTFVIVFVTIYCFELVSQKSHRRIQFATVSLITLFLVPIGISSVPVTTDGSMKIAAVQGNANAGLFAREKQGTILKNHLDVTKKLLASGEEFDLVVWPENASDKNPDEWFDAMIVLRNLVDNQLEKPLIFGTITSTGEEYFNSSKLYVPGRGEVDQYDKKRPVPFGEYVPDRNFFYQIAPDLIGMITRGYSFGARDGIFEVSGVKTGILICFEEAIDEVPREVVEQGAKVIIAQTNNADFGKSDESVQQLGIGRLRAIETGRAIVHISTVGPSAIIGPKGELIETTEAYVPAYLNAEVPLVSGKNLAMSGGWLFDPASAALGGVIALILIIDNRRKTTKL
jgi:apolipoprotein N-acyltransferase